MRHVLLASDFDGTIVPQGAAAGEVTWHPQAHALFLSLQDRDDVTLAIISGRDPDELLEATRGVKCDVVGSYGRHIRDRNGRVVRDAPPLEVSDGAWADAILRFGGVVERKRHGVAVHWRMSPTLGAHHAAVVAFRTWARARHLRVLEGRSFCEAVVRGPGKLAALRLLQERSVADFVIYAGDDRSDLGALRWAARHGRAFYLGRDRTALRLDHITTVASIEELWRRANTLRQLRRP